jgi:hypothetical protein
MPETKENLLPVSSSAAPGFAPEQQCMYVEVLTILSAHRIPFAVSGAFALHQHSGIWRDAMDLDLFLVHDDVPRALAALAREGFETEVCDPVWLSKARRGDFFVDLITGMSNAVITVQPEWIERAETAHVLGVSAKVLAAEELIASKLFITRRERFDGADIVHVIYATTGKLDWTRILELAADHWMMLLWVLVLYQYVYPAHSQFVPHALWHDLLSRLRKQIDRPDPDAPFRGSLIDENMFAIDIHEWGMANLSEKIRAERLLV